MKLTPLGDRLIVQAVEEEETTASGIVLPDTAKEKPQKGKVLAVGDGEVKEDCSRRPLDLLRRNPTMPAAPKAASMLATKTLPSPARWASKPSAGVPNPSATSRKAV